MRLLHFAPLFLGCFSLACNAFQSEETKEKPLRFPAPEGSTVAARFAGGIVTREEVLREGNRLPPLLREQFETEGGRRELARSMVDKRLLVIEAERQGLGNDPEIRRQVAELEERLVVQSLMAAEESKAAAVSEEDARRFYESQKEQFAEPERVHVFRVLAAATSKASPAERQQAKARAARFLSRLRAGEAIEKVAKEGDGPEREHSGDLGLLARGDRPDKSLEEAIFALQIPGDLSPVVECADGFAVLKLRERRSSRIPSFEEIRPQIETRLQPTRQRKIFDDLLARLRKDAAIELDEAALK